MVIVSDIRLTCTSETPGRRRTAFSTLATQAPQSIPDTVQDRISMPSLSFVPPSMSSRSEEASHT